MAHRNSASGTLNKRCSRARYGHYSSCSPHSTPQTFSLAKYVIRSHAWVKNLRSTSGSDSDPTPKSTGPESKNVKSLMLIPSSFRNLQVYEIDWNGLVEAQSGGIGLLTDHHYCSLLYSRVFDRFTRKNF